MGECWHLLKWIFDSSRHYLPHHGGDGWMHPLKSLNSGRWMDGRWKRYGSSCRRLNGRNRKQKEGDVSVSQLKRKPSDCLELKGWDWMESEFGDNHPLASSGDNPPQRVLVGGGDSTHPFSLYIPFWQPTRKATEAMHSLKGEWLEIIKMIISYIWFIHHYIILFTYLSFSYIASSVITPSLLYHLLLPCAFPSLNST